MPTCSGETPRMFREFSCCRCGPFAQFTSSDLVHLLEISQSLVSQALFLGRDRSPSVESPGPPFRLVCYCVCSVSLSRVSDYRASSVSDERAWYREVFTFLCLLPGHHPHLRRYYVVVIRKGFNDLSRRWHLQCLLAASDEAVKAYGLTAGVLMFQGVFSPSRDRDKPRAEVGFGIENVTGIGIMNERDIVRCKRFPPQHFMPRWKSFHKPKQDSCPAVCNACITRRGGAGADVHLPPAPPQTHSVVLRCSANN
ncbi:hypothetical protein EVAR_35549_1 [Eumeta japonica]|uniref:Uncharacterized protein n=1 Tax=Eumeta variegata TaxID=151549 RepID=A0A4C1X6V5_EUMVA|nr:hypothetical protein EVAR_35549_1 [Eumeta japonica]